MGYTLRGGHVTILFLREHAFISSLLGKVSHSTLITLNFIENRRETTIITNRFYYEENDWQFSRQLHKLKAQNPNDQFHFQMKLPVSFLILFRAVKLFWLLF
jgi:hypothetical protein